MRRYASFAVVLFVALAAAFAVGQQQPNERWATGAFAVASNDKGAVLLETQTGKTWVLQHPADKSQPAAWLPTIRFDSLEEAGNWRKVDRERGVMVRERSDLQRRLSDLKAIQERRVDGGPQDITMQALQKRISEIEAKLEVLK